MALRIEFTDFERLRRQAEDVFPNECCGLLVGTAHGDLRVVRSVISAVNEFAEEERFHRFLITPDVFREAEQRARSNGMDIIGFYHSHPDAEAIPSAYDREHAWPWYAYLILSVRNARFASAACWVLQPNRLDFSEQQLLVKHADEMPVASGGCLDIG